MKTFILTKVVQAEDIDEARHKVEEKDFLSKHNADDKLISLDELKIDLSILRDSCEQAIDGSWNHSQDEGGFESMVNGIEDVATVFGIELEPYKKSKEYL